MPSHIQSVARRNLPGFPAGWTFVALYMDRVSSKPRYPATMAGFWKYRGSANWIPVFDSAHLRASASESATALRTVRTTAPSDGVMPAGLGFSFGCGRELGGVWADIADGWTSGWPDEWPGLARRIVSTRNLIESTNEEEDEMARDLALSIVMKMAFPIGRRARVKRE